MKKINLVIYGATGSIGGSVLSIVRCNRKNLMFKELHVIKIIIN